MKITRIQGVNIMKITSLIIQPTHTWKSESEENPMRAVVKLASEKSVIECVLDDNTMRKMVALCADEIAKSAQARMNEFAASVATMEGDKASLMLGEDS